MVIPAHCGVAGLLPATDPSCFEERPVHSKIHILPQRRNHPGHPGWTRVSRPRFSRARYNYRYTSGLCQLSFCEMYQEGCGQETLADSVRLPGHPWMCHLTLRGRTWLGQSQTGSVQPIGLRRVAGCLAVDEPLFESGSVRLRGLCRHPFAKPTCTPPPPENLEQFQLIHLQEAAVIEGRDDVIWPAVWNEFKASGQCVAQKIDEFRDSVGLLSK